MFSVYVHHVKSAELKPYTVKNSFAVTTVKAGRPKNHRTSLNVQKWATCHRKQLNYRSHALRTKAQKRYFQQFVMLIMKGFYFMKASQVTKK